MKKNAIILGIVTFLLILSYLIIQNNKQDLTIKLNRPVKMEVAQGVAYSLDNMEGPISEDFTFRCDPNSGEGYFSLKSKNLVWSSTHCQDMVGAVSEILENKKPFAVIMIKEVDKRIFYRVQRNQSL
jgi:hypothetical protein